MIKELTQNDFDAAINNSAKALVDFWAPWCGPCRAQAPYLEQLPDTIDVFKVNVDDYGDLARRYGISSIPTLLVFKNGTLTKKAQGTHNLEQLKELLEIG